MISALTGSYPVENPYGIQWPFLEQIRPSLNTWVPVVISLAALLSIISFVVRFRKATGETRQQFKWFVAFLSTVVVVHIIGFEIVGALVYPQIFSHISYELILVLSFGGFPVVIGMAIFKYRLYDLDIIIRRTLSYAILTGILASIYFGSVILIQFIMSGLTDNVASSFIIALTTLIVAALFNPLRIRIQDIIDRRFNRQKIDAEQTLTAFAAAARDEVDIHRLTYSLLGVVEETLQPKNTSLWLKE